MLMVCALYCLRPRLDHFKGFGLWFSISLKGGATLPLSENNTLPNKCNLFCLHYPKLC